MFIGNDSAAGSEVGGEEKGAAEGRKEIKASRALLSIENNEGNCR